MSLIPLYIRHHTLHVHFTVKAGETIIKLLDRNPKDCCALVDLAVCPGSSVWFLMTLVILGSPQVFTAQKGSNLWPNLEYSAGLRKLSQIPFVVALFKSIGKDMFSDIQFCLQPFNFKFKEDKVSLYVLLLYGMLRHVELGGG